MTGEYKPPPDYWDEARRLDDRLFAAGTEHFGWWFGLQKVLSNAQYANRIWRSGDRWVGYSSTRRWLGANKWPLRAIVLSVGSPKGAEEPARRFLLDLRLGQEALQYTRHLPLPPSQSPSLGRTINEATNALADVGHYRRQVRYELTDPTKADYALAIDELRRGASSVYRIEQ